MEYSEFETRYMSRLNPQQREAVLSVEGPVLLLATPGSGKTTVLVIRLGYMVLCCGIDPRRILTMTYTRAAAKDMRSRFASLVHPSPSFAVCFPVARETAISVPSRSIFLIFFSNFPRGPSTQRPQPRQRRRKSAPLLSTCQRSPPQGCGFFMVSTSYSRTSMITSP